MAVQIGYVIGLNLLLWRIHTLYRWNRLEPGFNQNRTDGFGFGSAKKHKNRTEPNRGSTRIMVHGVQNHDQNQGRTATESRTLTPTIIKCYKIDPKVDYVCKQVK